jgi:hypothetical protein
MLKGIPGFLTIGFLKRDQAIAIDIYADAFAIESAPYASTSRARAALEGKFSARRFCLARYTIPAILSAQLYVEKARCRLVSTAAAVAALRFHKDNGRWPLSLSELVPVYLEEIPQDSINGGELAYSLIEDGIMIYSLGENGIDDGGKPSLVVPPDEEQDASDDVGFRIWSAPPEAAGE